MVSLFRMRRVHVPFRVDGAPKSRVKMAVVEKSRTANDAHGVIGGWCLR